MTALAVLLQCLCTFPSAEPVRYKMSMRFRTGLAIGLAVGYYYGAKAGRERYQQIDEYLSQVRSSNAYNQVVARLTQLAEESVGRGRVIVAGVAAGAPSVEPPSSPYDYVGDPTLN